MRYKVIKTRVDFPMRVFNRVRVGIMERGGNRADFFLKAIKARVIIKGNGVH